MAKHEINSMSHHSKHHFITQYISLGGGGGGTAVNEFDRIIRMGPPVMLEVTEQEDQ